MKVPRYPTGYTRQYMSIQLIVDGCMHLYYYLFFFNVLAGQTANMDGCVVRACAVVVSYGSLKWGGLRRL